MSKEILEELDSQVEQESKEERSKTYTLGGVEFEVVATDRAVERYIEDVVGPYSPLQERGITAKKYRISTIRASSDVLSLVGGKHIINADDGYEYGKLDENIYYVCSGLGFTHITSEEDRITSHYCISPRPELGAVSFIRTEMLKHYAKSDPFLVFHSASMIDTENDKMTVFSGLESSKPYGNRAGKTTALLSATIRPNPRYAFSSNDELIVTSGEEGVDVHPFPNQVPIRQGTLNAMLAEGIKLPVDFLIDTDEQTSESIFYTTPGQIKRAGYEISNRKANFIRNWIFTNLDPQQVGNSIVQISPEQSVDLFRRSAFPRRMNQSRSAGYQGESYRNYDMTPEDFDVADHIHAKLALSGTRFWILSRGVDRGEIYKAIESIDID